MKVFLGILTIFMAGVCGLLTLFLGYQYLMHPAHSGLVRLEFVARPTEEGAGEPTVLKDVETAVTKRLRANGIGTQEVTVENDKVIVVIPNSMKEFILGLLFEEGADLEFLLVKDGPKPTAESLSEHEGLEIKILPSQQDKQWYAVYAEPLLANQDFRHARMSRVSSGDLCITMEFTAEGGEKMYQYTSTATGGAFALALDEEIVMRVNPNGPIQKHAFICSELSFDEIQALIRAINFHTIPASLELVGTSQLPGTRMSRPILYLTITGLLVTSGMAGLAIFLLFSKRRASANVDIRRP